MSERRHGYVKAGPVEVRRPDGTTETHSAYSTAEFYAIVAARHDKKVKKAKQARQGR